MPHRFPPRSIVFVCAAFTLGACADDSGDRVQLYRARPHAPSYSEASVAALEHLGPTIVDHGIAFEVYSANASRMSLLVFSDPDAPLPTRQFDMTRFGDAWSVHVEGLGVGTTYGYVAWGPNWPFVDTWTPGTIDGFLADVDAAGNRFNPNKLLSDPYAKALHRDHDWSRGSLASGPARAQSTWAAASKSVVVDTADDYAWSANEAAWLLRRADPTAAGNGWHEQIVYEVHLKGFTADAASAVDHPGTYRGLAEKAAYFSDLGITAVELMPIFEKPLDGGYWGYHTLNWFAPEVSYAADPEPWKIGAEFKGMVDALHQEGIEVWLDVVYNHSGEGGLWREKLQTDDVNVDPVTSSDLGNFDPKEVAGLYSMRGLDNQAYYALTDDKQTYWQATGVGNQMRNNHRPFRKLTLDSLRYWVETYHIDGFRFDLAPALGATDLDYEKWDDPANTILQDIIDDPVLQSRNTRIVAEPWATAGDYTYKAGAFPAASEADALGVGARGWYEWNGHFRDWWRAFMNDDGWVLNTREGEADGGFLMTACETLYGANGRRPYHSLNFVSVHDGMTMYDVFTYPQKKNGCGPLNPICCDDPLSVWCDLDSGENNNRSRDWGGDANGEAMKRQLMRNLFVAMMISHGTPMLFGGDEWMRTQLGNNNAYSTRADNAANWFQWGTWQASDDRRRMHDFVRQLTRFRRAHLGKLAPISYTTRAPFAWKSPAGTMPPDWGSRQLMIHYTDETGGPQLMVLINMARADATFTLPTGTEWARLVDTQRWFDSPEYRAESGAPGRTSANIAVTPPPVVSGEYVVKDSSIVILEDVSRK